MNKDSGNPDSNAETKATSIMRRLLNKRLRMTLTDGRIVVGEMQVSFHPGKLLTNYSCNNLTSLLSSALISSKILFCIRLTKQ